jgi:hypothetical protein
MRSTELISIRNKLALLLVAVNANLELEGAAFDGAEAILIDAIADIEGVMRAERPKRR